MIIDGKKFTEIQDTNKSVVTFQRTIFENLKILIDSFEVGVIHDISFDDGIVRKIYTEPFTFSKNESGYTLSFILKDVPQQDIDSRDFNEIKPLIKECLQTASVETVKKYVAYLDKWEVGTKFTKGQRISYNGVPYIVGANHTAVKGRTPDTEPLLYEDMTKPKKAEKWDEKKTYNKGDLVTARNLVFISQLDNNKGNEPGFSNAWNYYKN
jgi:hypothetical protein|nr:MAG TPA: ChiA1-BD-binding domain protein [Caudoviricetes sp.]